MRKLVLILALCIAGSIPVVLADGINDPVDTRNCDTILEDEQKGGRWRTVGCGSYAFIDWRTYCCPSSEYDNCPGPGDCTKNVIYGCD